MWVHIKAHIAIICFIAYFLQKGYGQRNKRMDEQTDEQTEGFRNGQTNGWS
jgi:hypothetical protein